MINTNFIIIATAIFGACIGSFLNVCIVRMPEKISIVFPPSSCPRCNYRIKWYDNIPVLSYLLLLGKCRSCRTKISIQYPLVEILTSFSAVYSFIYFSLTLKTLVVFIFICYLIVISLIDLKYQIIPDELSLSGIVIFFLFSIFIKENNILDSVLGIITGGGSLYLIILLYYLIKKEYGMGGGDIKLLAMIGAFTGYKGVFFTIFMASSLGTIIGIPVMIVNKENMKYKIPFGPFLSIASIIYIFHGRDIIIWYLNFIR